MMRSERIFSSLCSLLILLFFAGCGKGSTEGPGEPNDRILDAGVMKPDRKIEMKIDSADDVDWYGIVVPSSGYIKTGVKKVPGDLDPEVRFAHKQEWEDQKQKWINGWDELPKSIRIPEADTIYLAVRDDNQDGSSQKNFPLRVSFIEEFDEHEPNGNSDRAVSAGVGKPIESSIYPVGDEERFKVKVDSAGYLLARSKKSPDDVDEEIRFGKLDEHSEEWKGIGGWGHPPHAVRVPESGEYRMVLRDDNNDGASQDPIEWKLDHLGEMDGTEPNGSPEKAEAIAFVDTVPIAIYPKGDRDFLKWTPVRTRKLSIKAEGAGDLDLEMRLWVQKDLKVKKQGPWKELPGKMTLKEGGKTYYLEVHDNNDNQSRPEAFELLFLKAARESS